MPWLEVGEWIVSDGAVVAVHIEGSGGVTIHLSSGLAVPLSGQDAINFLAGFRRTSSIQAASDASGGPDPFSDVRF